jgi:hypothetical protein
MVDRKETSCDTRSDPNHDHYCSKQTLHQMTDHLNMRSTLHWMLNILITANENFKTQPKMQLYHHHPLNITGDWQYVTVNCTHIQIIRGFRTYQAISDFPPTFKQQCSVLHNILLHSISAYMNCPTWYLLFLALSHTHTHVCTRYKYINP